MPTSGSPSGSSAWVPSMAVDIGAYDACAFGCAYCYATATPATGLANRRHHDPSDTVLLWLSGWLGVDLDARDGAEAGVPTLFDV